MITRTTYKKLRQGQRRARDHIVDVGTGSAAEYVLASRLSVGEMRALLESRGADTGRWLRRVRRAQVDKSLRILIC